MTLRRNKTGLLALAFVLGLLMSNLPDAFAADPIGLVKSSSGEVNVERAGQKIAADVGTKLFQSDVVITGSDGAVGMTFIDNSRLSLNPNSNLALESFRFNTTTHDGEFISSLRKGALAAVSGKIAKATPEAMKVRTPSAVLGVRGTKFLVSVAGQ